MTAIRNIAVTINATPAARALTIITLVISDVATGSSERDAIPTAQAPKPTVQYKHALKTRLKPIGLIAEVIRSPRAIRLRRFCLLAAVPFGLGLSVDGVMTAGGDLSITVLRAGLLVFGVAMLGMPLAGLARGDAARGARVVVALWRAGAAGCLLISATQAYLAVLYARAGYHLIAIGQVLVTIGALLLTAACARARPTLETRIA